MPTLDEFTLLLHHLADRQIPEAQHVVQLMIARERSKNHDHAAEQLQYALDKWQRQPAQFIELPQKLKPLVWETVPTVHLDDLIVDASVRAVVDRLLMEWRHQDTLIEAGLTPDNRLLLEGPPGNGKTSVAYAIAEVLDLPFLPVKTDLLIDSYLGGTGKNLNEVFFYANQTPCIVFFDELDAITSVRGLSDSSAGKEYNSMVTSFLTQLDRLSPQSLVVAATNLVGHLDAAVQRRFSYRITLDLPSPDQKRDYLIRYEAQHGVSLFPDPDAIIEKWLRHHSWAHVERFCKQTHKTQVLASLAGRSSDAKS